MSRNFTVLIIAVIVLVGIAAGVIWFNGKSELGLGISPSPSVSPTASATPDLNEVKSYTSQNLGVHFEYLAGQGDPIIEEGNTIYVGGKQGQFVRVFTKDPK